MGDGEIQLEAAWQRLLMDWKFSWGRSNEWRTGRIQSSGSHPGEVSPPSPTGTLATWSTDNFAC